MDYYLMKPHQFEAYWMRLVLSEHIPVKRAIRYSIAEKLDDQVERKLVMELVDTWVK